MAELTTRFLANASKLLPGDNPTTALLKSHYITKCRHFEYDQQVTLSRSTFGPHILCKNCGNPWNEVGKQSRVLRRKPLKRNARRLLNKTVDLGVKLRSLQKVFEKQRLNRLLQVCEFCKYRNVTELGPVKTEIVPKKCTPPNVIKKKKKKKDPFAGLNVNAVLQIQGKTAHSKKKHKQAPSPLKPQTSVEIRSTGNSKNFKNKYQDKKHPIKNESLPLVTIKKNADVTILKNIFKKTKSGQSVMKFFKTHP